jgi:RNA polymerase sigma factor (sigma-70 family)
LQSTLNTEQQLLSALANGDRKATEQIYKHNFTIVNGWLIKHGSNETDAADIFQEAMVILFSKAQDEEFRLTCSINTYVFSICKHLWYKKLQKQSREPITLLDNTGNDEDDDGLPYQEDVDAHQEREMHYDQLDAALEQIGEPCRSLLKAYYHHDKSMQEIAADFGYTNPDNAKTQKYKCLTRLRKIFYTMQ